MPPTINQPPIARQLLPARAVATRYGVHLGTLWRWIENGIIPVPHTVINRVRYWDLAELEAADRARAKTTAVKGRPVKSPKHIEAGPDEVA